MKHSNLRSPALLFLTAMIWGAAFVAQSVSMDYVGPFTFLASRSWLGGFFLLIFLTIKEKLGNSPAKNHFTGDVSTPGLLLKGGLCAGTALFSASILQQIGIQYTTVGKAGFLTALYVIFVPFLSLVVFRKKLPAIIWVCVALAVVGMGLLCLNGSLGLQLGDALELLCALVFSVHILVLDHFSPKVDPVRLSCIQFFVCAAIASVFMLILEQPSLSAVLSAWAPILYAGCLSSGVGYTLQVVAQKDCDPTLASLIMCLESVFSAVFGWLLLHQNLSLREWLGCGLMFGAIVLAQLPERNA